MEVVEATESPAIIFNARFETLETGDTGDVPFAETDNTELKIS